MLLPRFLLEHSPYKSSKNPLIKPPCTTITHHPLSSSLRKNVNDLYSPLVYPIERELTELGENVNNDIKLLNDLSWEAFVKSKQGRGDIVLLDKPYPANILL